MSLYSNIWYGSVAMKDGAEYCSTRPQKLLDHFISFREDDGRKDE
jgi:hypothetical protein